jgi:SAM-dependent methyltransferase
MEVIPTRADSTLLSQLLREEYSSCYRKGICSLISLSDLPRHLKILEKIFTYKPQTGFGIKYLDISIGSGFIARVLKKKGFLVEGVDSSDIGGDLDRRFKESGIPVFDINIEDQKLPFPDGSYDMIYWGATIEHLHNSPKFPMDEMFRVLRPGGIFIIDTPNILSLKHRILLLSGISFMPSIEYVYNRAFHGSHHREYTMSDLVKVCKWTGYEIVSSEYVDTFWPLSLKKMGKLGINRSSESEKSVFDLGFDWLNWYDYIKLPALILSRIFPVLREMLVIVCKKP